MKNLKNIVIQSNFKGVLDFSNFQDLITCEIKWNGGQAENIEACNKLEYLGISNYSEREIIFGGYLKNLRLLKVYSGKLTSLSKIDSLKNLQRLNLYDNYSLTDIDEIAKLRNSLKYLLILNCKKIKSYSPIGKLGKLESIFIDESTPTDNLSFLKNLNFLKKGYIGIEVLDRKLDILAEKRLEYKKYKSYSKAH